MPKQTKLKELWYQPILDAGCDITICHICGETMVTAEVTGEPQVCSKPSCNLKFWEGQ